MVTLRLISAVSVVVCCTHLLFLNSSSRQFSELKCGLSLCLTLSSFSPFTGVQPQLWSEGSCQTCSLLFRPLIPSSKFLTHFTLSWHLFLIGLKLTHAGFHQMWFVFLSSSQVWFISPMKCPLFCLLCSHWYCPRACDYCITLEFQLPQDNVAILFYDPQLHLLLRFIYHSKHAWPLTSY